MFCGENGYSMRLANGQSWHIIASEEAVLWVKKLAAIMELKICDQNAHPKLIFIRRKMGKDGKTEPICWLNREMQANLPQSGWRARKFRAVQIWSHTIFQHVLCDIGHDRGHDLDIIRKWMALFPIFDRAQHSGGLPLHAGLVERNGVGILLAAPGNTGKSTCCCRLPSSWHPLCDDETLVVRDNQRRYLAHPFPTWSDHLWQRSEKTWNVEGHVPVSAIFFLEQATTDEVVPVGQGETAVLINESAMELYHPKWKNSDSEELRAVRRKLFDNACELAKSIPAFKLRVSLKGRFWEEIERVLL
jgi:SynChlorMet cassette protein ScmC